MRPSFDIDEDQTLIIFCNGFNIHELFDGNSTPKNIIYKQFSMFGVILNIDITVYLKKYALIS